MILEKCSPVSLGDLAHNLAIRQNHAFPNLIAMTVSGSARLEQQITECEAVQTPKTRKPLVLVFGGQESAAVTLSKDLYSASVLLRSHLDHCDHIL